MKEKYVVQQKAETGFLDFDRFSILKDVDEEFEREEIDRFS